MDVGMDVGRLLDRFFIDFGAVLGGKLAPSWHQNPKKEGTKTRSKNEWSKTHATVKWASAGNPEMGGGPLRVLRTPTQRDQRDHLKHPNRHCAPQGCVADIYIYKFYYFFILYIYDLI